MEANDALSAQNFDAALALGSRLQALGAELGEPVLRCLGLALEGTIAIRRGEPERGFALLDEAMLPVLAGRIDPGWSGNLYCNMMSLCHDLADVSRARRWTEATQRWCDTFTSAVMFVGICRVHRTQLLRLAGEWERAVSEATAATVELAELNVEAVAAAYYEIGETHRLRGDLAAARAAYDEAVARGHVAQPGLALLLLAEGRDAEADATIRQALAEEADSFRRARLLAGQVEIACTRGDVATAEAAAAELAQDRRDLSVRGVHGLGGPGHRCGAGRVRAARPGAGPAAQRARPLRGDGRQVRRRGRPRPPGPGPGGDG